jgi:membrane protease YdiL (CAAX protease family)
MNARSRTWLMSAAALVYVVITLTGGIALRPALLEAARVVMADPALAGVLARLAPTLAACVAVLAMAATAGVHKALRWRSARAGSVWKVVGVVVLASILLDFTKVWPFAWKWRTAENVRFASSLVIGGEWPLVILQIFVLGLLAPVVEELVFRYGVLRVFWHASRRSSIAVLGSGFVFGLAHWGPSWAATINAAWVGVFGVFVGWLAVRRPRSLTLPIAAHATRNLLELGMLLLAGFLNA